MKARSIEKTVDCFPGLTPFERHILFLEMLCGRLSTLRYQELVKAHFPKKEVRLAELSLK